MFDHFIMAVYPRSLLRFLTDVSQKKKPLSIISAFRFVTKYISH